MSLATVLLTYLAGCTGTTETVSDKVVSQETDNGTPEATSIQVGQSSVTTQPSPAQSLNAVVGGKNCDVYETANGGSRCVEETSEGVTADESVKASEATQVPQAKTPCEPTDVTGPQMQGYKCK